MITKITKITKITIYNYRIGRFRTVESDSFSKACNILGWPADACLIVSIKED